MGENSLRSPGAWVTRRGALVTPLGALREDPLIAIRLFFLLEGWETTKSVGSGGDEGPVLEVHTHADGGPRLIAPK